MYSCYLFLIYPASVRSFPFLPLLCPSLYQIFPHISDFLEDICSLSHSTFFPPLFLCIVHIRRLFFSPLSSFWNSAFSCVSLSLSLFPLASPLFSSICKASSDNHFTFLHFFFLNMALSLSPVQCYEPPSIILQALCLSDLIP